MWTKTHRCLVCMKDSQFLVFLIVAALDRFYGTEWTFLSNSIEWVHSTFYVCHVYFFMFFLSFLNKKNPVIKQWGFLSRSALFAYVPYRTPCSRWVPPFWSWWPINWYFCKHKQWRPRWYFIYSAPVQQVLHCFYETNSVLRAINTMLLGNHNLWPIDIHKYTSHISSIKQEEEASVHPSELRVRLAPWNRFKPPSKIILLTLPRRCFFCGSFMLFLSKTCVCYALVRVCLLMSCGHLLGKGWPIGSHLWCIIVSLLLSHWYPGSGVVLDCIDSWSLSSLLL